MFFKNTFGEEKEYLVSQIAAGVKADQDVLVGGAVLFRWLVRRCFSSHPSALLANRLLDRSLYCSLQVKPCVSHSNRLLHEVDAVDGPRTTRWSHPSGCTP